MWWQPPFLVWLLLAAMLYVLVTVVLAVLSHLHASEVERHDLIHHARSRWLAHEQDNAERRKQRTDNRSAWS